MSVHTCHAHGCTERVPPKMFACRAHWAALPKVLRDAIWTEYQVGQERDKQPTARYMAVQRRACAVLAFKPDDEKAQRISLYFLEQSERWRARAVERGEGDPLVLADAAVAAGRIA